MRNESYKRNKQGKFMKIICLPIRILSNARDLYVKSMVVCAGRVGHGGGIVCYTPPEASRLPKSFSVGSSMANDGEDFRQLLRAASKHGTDAKVEWKMQHQRSMGSSTGGIMGTRSYRVGIGKIGRIDEDEPCSFVEDEIDAMADMLYPRTRSPAVRRNLIVYR